MYTIYSTQHAYIRSEQQFVCKLKTTGKRNNLNNKQISLTTSTKNKTGNVSMMGYMHIGIKMLPSVLVTSNGEPYG